MVLPAILNPFAQNAPAAVMTRIALDWIIDGTPLDELFDEVAEDQYTREFTLTHLVQVMLDVASGCRPSPRAAFLRRDLSLVASISAFYRKLNRMGLAVPEAVVRRTASRARRLIVAGGGLLPEPIEGYAARVLDGNVMTGTEHRIVPLRTTWSAGLPGMSLAVYEPASGLILDLILEEDAHCQERALLDRVEVRPGQLWIMDRNFCVRSLIFRMARRDAFFLVRWHRSTLPFVPAGRTRSCGRCPSGRVYEQPIDVADGEGGVHRLRRIVLKLDRPTRDGEAEIVLVTNLPPEVTALQCCEAYRGRWRIEGHYQALTDLLHCEVPGLGYPRAALFAFSMSAVAGNALAVLKGNLRVAHGTEMAEEVSDFALVGEVAEAYPGMMMAVPPARWPNLARCRAATVSRLLNELADRVPVYRMLRCRRGPKKPQPKRSSGKRIRHVSNKKLLDRAHEERVPTRRSRSPTMVRI
ncbi:MAG: Transposase domain protein [Acidimicrobiales bacterium]|nr:Transposase domain protein [Acidimicrobiales bacterium]